MIKQPKFKPGDAVCFETGKPRIIIETSISHSITPENQETRYFLKVWSGIFREEDLRTRDDIYQDGGG